MTSAHTRPHDAKQISNMQILYMERLQNMCLLVFRLKSVQSYKYFLNCANKIRLFYKNAQKVSKKRYNVPLEQIHNVLLIESAAHKF